MCGKMLWSACILLSVWLTGPAVGRISTLAPPFICLAMQAGVTAGPSLLLETGVGFSKKAVVCAWKFHGRWREGRRPINLT